MLLLDWLKMGTYGCFVWLNQNLLLEDEPYGVFLFSHSTCVLEVQYTCTCIFHAQGVKQSVCLSVIVVGTKITRFRV